MLLCTPVHSSASFKGTHAVSLILAATSLGLHSLSTRNGFTPGTNLWAKSKRLWNRSVITIGSAPAARAERSEMRPMGPAPLQFWSMELSKRTAYVVIHQINTGSPRRSSALSMPAKATDNGSHSAPSSKLTMSGKR
jgi:hypothetical protein